MSDAGDRLLEDFWAARSRRASRRELITEAAGAGAFLAVAVPLAVMTHPASGALCVLLTVVYAVVARTIRFPMGTGFVVPTYLVLVPMLLLLPPTLVPLLVCTALALGSAARWLSGRDRAQCVLFAIPDAWHSLGPALVLAQLGHRHGVALVAVDVAAFAAGCLLDLISSSIRERLISGIAPGLHVHVVLSAWLLDACFAPLGLGITLLARHDLWALLLLVPLGGLMILSDRDRTDRIAQSHERLEQTLTDPLTGLGNRRGLAEALDHGLATATAAEPLMLAIFDLDGFKAYNDILGHVAGDALLARLGSRLRAATAPEGSAFRLGGDEFCALLPAADDPQGRLDATATALSERDGELRIAASCGSVLLPAEAADAESALALADRRMYACKRARRVRRVEPPADLTAAPVALRRDEPVAQPAL